MCVPMVKKERGREKEKNSEWWTGAEKWVKGEKTEGGRKIWEEESEIKIKEHREKDK